MTLKPKEISVDFVREIFEYKDGLLFRKKGGKKDWAGKPAGTLGSGGYLQVRVKGKLYLIHRLVWILHGKEFAPIIDHINGDKLDNRIENLRASSQSQNSMNRCQRSDNTSGVKGVQKKKNRWYVSIVVKGKSYYGGCFKTKEEAAEAVDKLRKKLHGEFARS